MSITYVHILLAFTGALLFILAQVLIRKPWKTKPSGIQNFLHQENPVKSKVDHEHLVPLMVYEEDYPTFGNIVKLVLENFPLKRFLQEKDFEKALTYLNGSVFKSADPRDLAWAMCQIVNTFISDPDVEYRCRPHLKALVNQFLDEVERPPG